MTAETQTESYAFAIVEPVKRAPRKGAGRRPEPNPFTDGVRQVVGQVDENGAPRTVAAPFWLNTEKGETIEQRSARIRRFLTRAGKELAAERGEGVEPYRISMAIQPDDDFLTSSGYVVKFWDARAGK